MSENKNAPVDLFALAYVGLMTLPC